MELNPPVPTSVRCRRWVWGLVWIAATVFFLVFYRPFDWREVARHLAPARAGWLMVAVLANSLILVGSTALWRRLLPRTGAISWGRMWEIVTLTAVGLNTLPFLGGHALAVGLLVRRGGVGIEVAAAVLTLDQLCEGLAKVTLLLLALAVAPLPDWMRHAVLVIGGAMLGLLLALTWLVRQPAGATGRLARWRTHFEILREPRRWLGGLGLSAGIKLAEAAGIYAVQLSLGIDLPPATLAVVLAAVNVATMISVTPGNLGVYEAAAVAVYVLLGVPPAQALALALVQHACFLVAMLVPGYALTGWRILNPAR